MSYRTERNRGFFGPENDPTEEYIKVGVFNDPLRAVFEKTYDGDEVEYSLKMPTDMNNNGYIRMISEFDGVFPDSTVKLMPDFPIGEGSYDETELTFYQVRSEEERNSHAMVETELGVEENTGWIVWGNEQGKSRFRQKTKIDQSKL